MPLCTVPHSAKWHLRKNLPQKYTRWTTIDRSTRAVVLASNRSKSKLALGFNLDTLEKIGRLTGVRWIPTWNLPEETMHSATDLLQTDIDLDLLDWPDDLPSLPSLTWQTIWQLEKHQWPRLWEIIWWRREMREKALGKSVPEA